MIITFQFHKKINLLRVKTAAILTKSDGSPQAKYRFEHLTSKQVYESKFTVHEARQKIFRKSKSKHCN